MIRALALCCALGAAPAAADPQIAAAFEDWLGARDGRGALAVMAADGTLTGYDLGMRPEAPAELASLSKAITATCLAALVSTGHLDWSDRFDALYGSGPPVSMAALTTQTSGLGPDSTQMGMPLWLDDPTPRAAEVLRLMALRGGQAGTPGHYAYNNENYALLGLALEARMATPLAELCQAVALDPAGVIGTPSPRTGAFLAWGGWQMSPLAYARFARHWFGAEGVLDQTDYPVYQGRSEGYGPGMILRRSNGAYWHAGALCLQGRLSVGALVLGQQGHFTVVAVHDVCDDADGLDAALWQAARAASGATE